MPLCCDCHKHLHANVTFGLSNKVVGLYLSPFGLTVCAFNELIVPYLPGLRLGLVFCTQCHPFCSPNPPLANNNHRLYIIHTQVAFQCRRSLRVPHGWIGSLTKNF